jgi:hypothetical protein
MADLKISALTSATTPLAGTEVLPLVQSSTTKKVAVSDLTAGRTVTLGQGIISRNMSSGNWLVLDDSRSGFGDWSLYKAGSNDLTFGYDTTGGSAPVSAITFEYGGDVKIQTGNVILGTSGKGITDSTGAVKLNFSTAGTALSGAQSVYTGDFFNVGTAQTITITDTNGGYIVITGVQGGVGSSTSTVPFVKRGGSIAIGTPSKAILTADPIASITASAGNISVTPLAANTYITYAIYYTPLAL